MAIKLDVRGLSVHYGTLRALDHVNLTIPTGSATALIGPTGAGKSSLLRALCRMNELWEGVTTLGQVLLDDENIYSRHIDVSHIRRRVSLIPRRPVPFPLSVFDNIAYGPRIHGVKGRTELANIIKKSLEKVGLWKELKDRLEQRAIDLSPGQKQRLCVARALAVEPEALLIDDLASGLDSAATARMEDVLLNLKGDYTIVFATHTMQQAGRVSDHVAYLSEGALIEHGDTADVFSRPKDHRTEDYITGRFS